MSTSPCLVGIDYVALEVDDLEAAIAFYGAIFELRGVDREPGMAFIDMGDQFLALSTGRRQSPDQDRHFGLVVDDKPAVRAALIAQGVDVLPGPRLDFRDPWGNGIQIVDYPGHSVHHGSAGDPRNGPGAPAQASRRDTTATHQGIA